MRRPVGLIQCVKGKGPRPCAAKDLYRGTFFVLGRRYLEARCDGWAVLSAKYGLVMPGQIIAPYELTLHATGIIKAMGGYQELTAAGRDAWHLAVRGQVEARFPGRSFLALASREYLRGLDGLPVEAPLAHMRIFERNAYLKRQLLCSS